MSGIWALLPFKGARGAKRRLAPLLGPEEREALVLAMLRDVLAALTRSPQLAAVLLVSRDAAAASLGREFGIDIFRDGAADLSGAVVEASRHAAAAGAGGTLFVPGDVPLIAPQDIAAIVDGHERATLVPDAAGIGTNAAAASPPNAFEYLFDGRSFKPHIGAARRAGIEPRILRLPAFGLDVDTVAALGELRAAGADAARAEGTIAFLDASGIAARLRGGG